MATAIEDKYYPYHKVYGGYSSLLWTSVIPRKIMDYLLDMPDGKYTPKDDNEYPRTAFWKYLYYDEANPLDKALPTPAQKKSVLFDPYEPTTPPSDKGYRLIPQYYTKPAQTIGQTRLYVYMGRTIPTDDFTEQLSVVFDIWTHYTLEANTKEMCGYSRLAKMEQCLMAAFHGVNMTGVGSFYFNRSRHGDCGSTPMTDKDSNVGRHIILGLEVKSLTLDEATDIPLSNGFFG